MADAVEADLPNWEEIDPDLLQEIADQVADIPDRFRFRAVCTKWKSRNLCKKPQRSPWLHLPVVLSSPADDRRLDFVSTSEKGRLYSIPHPAVRVRAQEFCRILAFPNGWLLKVTNDFSDVTQYFLSLLNPITHSSLPLPPVLGGCPGQRYKVFGSESDVVVGFIQSPNLRFCRPGDSSWSSIGVGEGVYSGFVLRDGCFLVLGFHTKVTRGFDMKSGELVLEIPSIWDSGVANRYMCNFVESPSGELLLVMWQCKPFCFEVYRLDEFQGEKANPEWVKLGSIGDCTIFWHIDNALCLALNGLEGYKGNSIYFLDNNPRGWGELGLRLFDIGKGQIEGEPLFSFESGGSFPRWFVPSLC